MSSPRIAVFGAGGIGGYFGARLASAGADVRLIARGSHLAALTSHGLTVHSALGNAHVRLEASDDPKQIGPCDVVLLCVKGTDTERAAASLAPLLKTDTAVVSLQNGVDNEAVIARHVPAEHVVGGVAYILATISAPGTIAHEGSLARLVFGELDGSRTKRLERLLALCEDASVDAELSTDIRAELWRKYAMICATAGMTAAVRLPLGEIRAAPASLATYRRIVEEVVAVSAAVGVGLPADTAERIMTAMASFPGEWYSSLHYDLTHGKPMELETLHGTLLRLADEHGVAAPTSRAIYGTLEPWAARNRARK